MAFVEKHRELVEGVGRDLLEGVGGDDVLQMNGCPWFLRDPRNPTTRVEDSRPAIGTPNTAAPLTGRASDLCWHDAKRPVSVAV